MASFALHCTNPTLQVQPPSNPEPGQRHLSCSILIPKTFQHSSRCLARAVRVNASLNEVAVQKLLKLAAETREEVESPKEKKNMAIPDASAITAFMTQAADLVQLVDSRDIIELQLRQSECEITIRKKEAFQPAAAQVPMMQASPPPPQPVFHYSSPPPPPPASSSAPATSSPRAAPSASPPNPSSSSHPPFKCPMAGTLYRSPAPGAPPFVKVGDKVQKGQVICIIEAMKLMNEIEADQSGTVAEIFVEDGKPVSVDTPLFAIVP